MFRIKDFANERGIAGIDAYNKDCAFYNRKTTIIMEEIESLEKRQRRKA